MCTVGFAKANKGRKDRICRNKERKEKKNPGRFVSLVRSHSRPAYPGAKMKYTG
jgi:hypothetical protein